jgi:hypothetical protein
MSKGLDLRLRTVAINDPIFHPPGDSHGDDDASWEKLLARPPELSDNPTSTDIWKHVGGRRKDEGVRISRISIFDTSTDILHAVKSYDMGFSALVPIRRTMRCGFLSPLKIHRFGWV